MKVKICGITNLDDAGMCEDIGADALGFVHFPGRHRSLSLTDVRDICSTLGPLTTRVLVCAPSDLSDAFHMLHQSEADLIQTYTLSPEELDLFREQGCRAIRVVPPDRGEASRFSSSADALVFESGMPGTGSGYDYSKIPMDCCERAIIAGGLNPGNVESLRAMRPYGVDVSSGVEKSPGRKDSGLVSEFIRRCRE